MKPITKLELQQANVKLAQENAELRKQLGDNAMRIELLRAECEVFAQSAHNAIARNDGLARAARQLPPHMQAAKDLAQRSGITVKVSP